MATIAATMFAAVAFAGAGYLFSHLDKKKASHEMERHNNAMEALTAARQAFYENETKKKDKIAELRERIYNSKHNIEDANNAFDALKRVKTIVHSGKKFHREPHINDFYKPSDEMKKYMDIASVGIGAVAGTLIYYFI